MDVRPPEGCRGELGTIWRDGQYSQPPPKHPPLPDDQQKFAGMKQDGVDEEEDVDKTLQKCPNLQHIRGKLLGSFLNSIGVSQLCDFTTHCID